MIIRIVIGLTIGLAGAFLLVADDESKPAKADTSGGKNIDFDSFKDGEPPDEVFVIEGDITVVKESKENKVLRIGAEPIVEGGALFGKSFKGAGSIQASVLGTKRRRVYPRFGIGLHGISGYRLRLDPGKKALELVKDEEVVATAVYLWESSQWHHLKLQIIGASKTGWTVEGRVWKEGEKEPAKALISAMSKESPGQGKASVWGTPYSGKPISFDNIKMSGGK